MKKSFYLIMAIVALSLIIAGCGNPVVPPVEQSNTNNLTKGSAINVPGDYSTIQAAIDRAVDGDTIFVHEGTYNESILIDGVDLSLIAVGDVTINNSSVTNKTINILNSICKIDGFKVKGGMVGIYAREMVDVTIHNNMVFEYLKNGITINLEPAIGHVYNNTIIGGGPIGYPHYAQNGIQFGYGATGTILKNTVEGNWYTGENWSACGILIFEANDVTVQGNSVKGSQTGIASEAWGWYFSSADGNKIVRNTINGAEWGISVAAYAWTYTNSDVSVNNNKVVNNIVEADAGDTGVYVGTWNDGVTSFSALADNNKIIHNKISGYDTEIDDYGIASKVHANVLE